MMKVSDNDYVLIAARIVSSYCRVHDCEDCPFFIDSEAWPYCVLNKFDPWTWFTVRREKDLDED